MVAVGLGSAAVDATASTVVCGHCSSSHVRLGSHVSTIWLLRIDGDGSVSRPWRPRVLPSGRQIDRQLILG